MLCSTGRGAAYVALQCGVWHGVACVSVVHALDRKRVLCHAQEPLMGLIVLYMILLYCFYRGPGKEVLSANCTSINPLTTMGPICHNSIMLFVQ